MNIIKKLFGKGDAPQFNEMNLVEPIQKALEKAGYTTPTPIQAQAIPPILDGRDLQGIAQTGTGKTAAFSLPILDYLHRHPHRARAKHTRVLILTPTRELAAQIKDSLDKYGSQLHFKTAVIFGGVNERPQIRAMDRGVDLLVATPGRLLDLMNQGHLKLDSLEIFVLDEADRMLDMGFIRDVRKVVAVLPAERQTLFFSATMPPDIARLAHDLLEDPVKVEVTPPATTVERIDQKIMFVAKSDKIRLLSDLLVKSHVKRALVFSRTKHGADKIVKALERDGIDSAAIHGNKSQGARVRALKAFKEGSLHVMVATDLAARGIDVDGITHVFNYDLPNEPETYVHRIGRTARAGKDGHAIAFCDDSEQRFHAEIERTIRMKIPVDKDHAWHADHDPNAPQFKQHQRGQRSSGGSSTGSGRGGQRGGQRGGGSRSSGSSSGRSGGGGRGRSQSGQKSRSVPPVSSNHSVLPGERLSGNRMQGSGGGGSGAKKKSSRGGRRRNRNRGQR